MPSTGRRQESVAELMNLADLIPGLRVFDAATTEMSCPFNHRASVDPAWGADMWIQDADVIVMLDCDVP